MVACASPLSLMAIKLYKCGHKNGRNEIKLVQHDATIMSVFKEKHGLPACIIDAKCSVKYRD